MHLIEHHAAAGEVAAIIAGMVPGGAHRFYPGFLQGDIAEELTPGDESKLVFFLILSFWVAFLFWQKWPCNLFKGRDGA